MKQHKLDVKHEEGMYHTQKDGNNGTSAERDAAFQGLGWRVRLQQRRSNYFLTLIKELVVGNGLGKGDPLFYYLVKCSNRNAVLIFLDGQERARESAVMMQGVPLTVEAED